MCGEGLTCYKQPKHDYYSSVKRNYKNQLTIFEQLLFALLVQMFERVWKKSSPAWNNLDAWQYMTCML